MKLRRMPRSLFFKLLMVYGLTFFGLCWSVYLGFRLTRAEDPKSIFRTNIKQYAEYLTKDIGTPPNLDRARELHEKVGLHVEIRGPQLDFSTAGSDHIHSRWSHRKSHTIQKNDYEFRFLPPHQRDSHTTALLLTLALAFGVLVFSYWWVRRIFKPVRLLKNGAEEFGKGNWDQRVPVQNCDELGDLSITMNSMADRIQTQFRSLQELLLAISHELRSPLTRMKVSLEFISDPKIRNSLNEEIQLLDHMTANLLERERLNTKPESLQKKQTNLNSLLKQISAAYETQTPGVELHLPDHEIEKNIDPDRLAICIRNLIENALKYSGTEKPIQVRLVKGEAPRIEIEDFGKGLSKEELAHIREPFYRTDASRTGAREKGGFGLGLSLCESIIKAHGGNLEITSHIGEGTQVSISL